MNTLENTLKELNELSNTLKAGEINFYECNETIVQNTEQCIELLVTEADFNIIQCLFVCHVYLIIFSYFVDRQSKQKQIFSKKSCVKIAIAF